MRGTSDQHVESLVALIPEDLVPHDVKGGDKVYHRGVAVQGKCPVKCSARMSPG